MPYLMKMNFPMHTNHLGVLLKHSLILLVLAGAWHSAFLTSCDTDDAGLTAL